jgi:hypothetical protein
MKRRPWNTRRAAEVLAALALLAAQNPHDFLTTLTTLASTRKFLEIDWANGFPVATSGRLGVGYVG